MGFWFQFFLGKRVLSVVLVSLLSSGVPAFSNDIQTSGGGTDGVVTEETGAQRCVALETRFRDHLLEQIDPRVERFSSYRDCLAPSVQLQNGENCRRYRKHVDTAVEGAQRYRQAADNFYRGLVAQWVSGLSEERREFAENCLGPLDSIQFENHYRTLRVTHESPNLCTNVQANWETDLSRREAAALQDPSSIGVSAEDVEIIRAFRGSHQSLFVSDATAMNPNLNEDGLRESLYTDFNRLNENMTAFRQAIADLDPETRPGDLYVLYEFRNQFQQFLRTLPENERAEARRCEAESGIQSCLDSPGEVALAANPVTLPIALVNNPNAVPGRCFARISGLAQDLLPWMPFVDDLQGYAGIDAAVLSGALTEEEAAAARNMHDLTVALGFIPPTLQAGRGVPVVATALAREGVETGVETAAGRLAAGALADPEDIAGPALRVIDGGAPSPAQMMANQARAGRVTRELEQIGVDLGDEVEIRFRTLDGEEHTGFAYQMFGTDLDNVTTRRTLIRGVEVDERVGFPRLYSLEDVDPDSIVRLSEPPPPPPPSNVVSLPVRPAPVRPVVLNRHAPVTDAIGDVLGESRDAIIRFRTLDGEEITARVVPQVRRADDGSSLIEDFAVGFDIGETGQRLLDLSTIDPASIRLISTN